MWELWGFTAHRFRLNVVAIFGRGGCWVWDGSSGESPLTTPSVFDLSFDLPVGRLGVWSGVRSNQG